MISNEILKHLSQKAYENSISHGFDMSDTNKWLTIAACEVAELVDAYRRGKRADSSKMELYKLNVIAYYDNWKDTLQDEMADIAIYCLSIIGSGEFKVVHREDYKEEFDEREERGEKHSDFYFSAARVMNDLLTSRILGTSSLYHIIDYMDAWMKEETGDILLDWIQAKMNFNKNRPYLHGRQEKQ